MKTFVRNAAVALFMLSAVACTKENIRSNTSASTNLQLAGTAAPVKYHIGESFGGGIIFYLDSTKLHGLIAATADQSSSARWYNGAYTLVGVKKPGIGTGAANTRKIVAALGNTGTYAALVCSQLSTGGFSDWYLPSKDELAQLFKQRAKVGGFVASNYWSSTEADANNAWDIEFGGGFKFADDKSFTINVRAVRSF